MRIGTASNGRTTAVVVQDPDGTLRAWADLYPALANETFLSALIAARAGTLPIPSPCRAMDEAWRLSVPHLPERNVICVGTNYLEHAQEFANFSGSTGPAAPEFPVVFTKVPEALCGPTDEIPLDPDWTQCLDYEVELGVIIGKGGARIEAHSAIDHIAGYTIINDVTARDRQKAHKQWFLGKSMAGATPIGPVVVTPDELPDLDQIELRASVDDEPRQKALVRDMIFDVATLISTISSVFPLRAGDLIATGTPSGVGMSFDPPRYLSDGSVVTCSIDGIGSLVNRIRLASPGSMPSAVRRIPSVTNPDDPPAPSEDSR